MKTIDVEIMDNSVNTSNSELKYWVQSTKKIGNKYEPKVALEDKVYPNMYYNHQPRNVAVDETLAKIKAQELQIAKWTLTEDSQLMRLNQRTNAKPQLVKINA
jgi:thiamine biosynthesis lipoprotein ApbE